MQRPHPTPFRSPRFAIANGAARIAHQRPPTWEWHTTPEALATSEADSNGLPVYKCDLCESVVAPNCQAHRLVVATRQKSYPYRENANPRMKKDRCAVCKQSESGHRHLDHPFRSPADDPGGRGFETVRELSLCPGCFARQQTSEEAA